MVTIKTSIKKIVMVCFVITTLFTSCDQGATLQTYFVDNQETANFISIDIPVSFVQIDEEQLNEEQLEAYESIDKLNMLGYRLEGDNEADYKLELEKVQTILKSEKYQDLFRGGNNKDGKIVVKYIGEDSTIDELILFGNMNNTGFAVIRVLGNKMDPAKIMKLGDVVQSMTSEENSVNDFMKFFNVEAPKELQLPPETIEIIED